MDHKYVNSNSIFGIYIHELAYVPIFKAFAHFFDTSGRDTYRYVEMTATLLELPYFHDR